MDSANLEVEVFIDGSWKNGNSIALKGLTEDRNNFFKMLLELNICTKAIRFFIHGSNTYASEGNLGKIILGNISVTKLV